VFNDSYRADLLQPRNWLTLPVDRFTFVGRVLKFGRSAPMELFVVANSKSIVSPFPLSGVAGNGALGHVPFPLDFQQFHF